MPFCTRCGVRLEAGDRFCGQCGAQVRSAARAPTLDAPASVASRPVVSSSPDAVSDVPPREALGAAAPLREPEHIAPQTLLSFASATEVSPARRLLLIILGVVLVALSGVAGYRWFTATAAPIASSAVDGTEQRVESSGSSEPSSDAMASLVADFTTGTTDPANGMGRPDGRLAVIAPGGSLALAWTDGPFYNGDGPDIRVHGPVGRLASYVIFARNGADDRWARFDVNRKGFVDGIASHDFGHHAMTRAQQIMVRNDGKSALYLDAIVPVYRQAESHSENEAGGHPPAQ